MGRRNGGKKQGAGGPEEEQPVRRHTRRAQLEETETAAQRLPGPSGGRAATRSSNRAKEAVEQLAGPQSTQLVDTRHGQPMQGDEQTLVNSAAVHATNAGCTRRAAAAQMLLHGPASKRHRHGASWSPSPPSPDEDVQGPLARLPEGLLDHMMSLLAAEEGGSCIRATCSWLCSAFDRCNTRLVLQEPEEQLPDSFPARLLNLLRCSPRVSSLTLAEGMGATTWHQVLGAGGPQLLQRLERLLLLHRPSALDLEALAVCSRLQHLCLHGSYQHHQYHQSFSPALQLQPLAACRSSLRHLEIRDCGSVEDLTPLAACAALQHLDLRGCHQLQDLRPLAACVGLQELRLSRCASIQDLSPLTACTQLHTLHVSILSVRFTDLGPLAACAALQELSLLACTELSNLGPLASCTALQTLVLCYCGVSDLAPLAACVGLQRLDLEGCLQVVDLAPLAACVALLTLNVSECKLLEDLAPLAACTGLQVLNLEECVKVVDLRPLSACAGLHTLCLSGCSRVRSLSPLASCLALKTLNLTECRATGRRGLAAWPDLDIIQ